MIACRASTAAKWLSGTFASACGVRVSPGADRVDGDAVGADLDRRARVSPCSAPLLVTYATMPGGGASSVDEVTRMTQAAGRAHGGQEGLQQVEGAVDVDPHDRPPLVDAQVGERAHLLAGGAVHEDAGLARLAANLLGGAGDRVRIGDIAPVVAAAVGQPLGGHAVEHGTGGPRACSASTIARPMPEAPPLITACLVGSRSTVTDLTFGDPQAGLGSAVMIENREHIRDPFCGNCGL